MERVLRHFSREELILLAPQATENYAFETSLFSFIYSHRHQGAEISVELLHELNHY